MESHSEITSKFRRGGKIGAKGILKGEGKRTTRRRRRKKKKKKRARRGMLETPASFSSSFAAGDSSS